MFYYKKQNFQHLAMRCAQHVSSHSVEFCDLAMRCYVINSVV